MRLTLQRDPTYKDTTIGKLYINDKFECFTLEDAVRSKKVKNETAIPASLYKVSITYSNRFQRNLPLLIDVPNFSGVRIHPGNTKENTEGCILVGKEVSKDRTMILRSRDAFNPLYDKILKAFNAGEPINISIINGVKE